MPAGAPTPAPVAGAVGPAPGPALPPPPSGQQPAAAQPVGPTPECPCLTTPAPTEEPGSPDASKEQVKQAAHDAAVEGNQEILEAGQAETKEQVSAVKDAGEKGSVEISTKELKKVREKHLGPHMEKLQAEHDNADKIEKEFADQAKAVAKERTADVLDAAAELSTLKAQNVINKVLQGCSEEANATWVRAIELANEAEDTNKVALAASNKALTAAHDAQSAALTYSHETAMEATSTAQDAEQKALWLQVQQAKAQQMAEAAAKAAELAKEAAANAFISATTAKETAEKALHQSIVNGEKLVKLKVRASTAMNAASGAARAVKMSEELVAQAREAREASLAVTTFPPGLF